MVSIICLTWVGFKLHAPTWYFCLLIIAALLRTYSLGIKLGSLTKD